MASIELNDKEKEALQHALEVYLSDLRMEIADTEKEEMRADLKAEEATLKAVLERLRG